MLSPECKPNNVFILTHSNGCRWIQYIFRAIDEDFGFAGMKEGTFEYLWMTSEASIESGPKGLVD